MNARTLLAPVLLITLPSSLVAKTPGDDTAGIVKKAMARNLFGLSGTARARMTMHSSRGEEKVRDLDVKLMRNKAAQQRILVTFRSPAEVAGTAFLVVERPDGAPDQYLYLPALKKVRRIAAGQATDSFMGSDFTFLDLSPLPQGSDDQVTYRRLKDTTVGGQPAQVIEAIAKIPGAPYSKVIIAIHKQHLVPLRLEFFDPLGKALKTATMKKLKKIGKKIVPVEMEMRNTQKGSWTVLSLTELNLRAKLTEAEFTPEAMQN